MGEENSEETKNNNNGGGADGDLGNKGNNNNNNKNNEKKKESGSINVVFKVHMHCEGCVTKLIKSAHGFNGVESVKAEPENSKLTVTGRVDPMMLWQKLKKSKKEIQLISPLPKKENKQPDAKPAEPKTKAPPVTTTVLKVHIHCHGCFEKIQKITSRFKGVHTSSIDQEKELVTVTGTLDVKALQAALKEKVKRAVEIIPPKKEKVSSEGNGEGGKNQKGGGGGGGKNGGGNGGSGKSEVNLMQYYGYGYEYGPGYFVEPVHPPQLFSDENPNACSIM